MHQHQALCVWLMSHAGINTSRLWPALFHLTERGSPGAKAQLCHMLEYFVIMRERNRLAHNISSYILTQSEGLIQESFVWRAWAGGKK